MGEYNKANLMQALPIMPQHISCLTKETPCMQASKAVPEGPILETLPFLSYWNLNKDSRSSAQAGSEPSVVVKWFGVHRWHPFGQEAGKLPDISVCGLVQLSLQHILGDCLSS